MSPGALLLPARPTKRVTFRAPDAQLTALNTLAEQLNTTPSALARLALGRGLELLQAEHGHA